MFAPVSIQSSPEDKIYRQHQEHKPDEVIEAESLVFEKQDGKAHENAKRDRFLDHFQFNQRKRAAVFPEADPVGGNLKAIFKQRNTPTDQHD